MDADVMVNRKYNTASLEHSVVLAGKLMNEHSIKWEIFLLQCMVGWNGWMESQPRNGAEIRIHGDGKRSGVRAQR